MSSLTKAILSGLALTGFVSTGNALPTAPTALFSTDAANAGTYIWISQVSPTIFGKNSTDYDYYLFDSPATAAKEAVQAYSQAVAAGNEDTIVTTFLNATQGGTMTSEEAGDIKWKCFELGAMRAAVTSCQNVGSGKPSSQQNSDNKLVTRSRYTWKTSKSHVSNAAAVDALAGALGRNRGYTFPQSPRSYCLYASNVQACFSYSLPEKGLTYGAADDIISDAQSVVGFNTYSAQANGILDGGADVCISNRADDCT